ncbi:MAG: hypothetical protein AAF990_01990 [Bacteroidota bacterium]
MNVKQLSLLTLLSLFCWACQESVPDAVVKTNFIQPPIPELDPALDSFEFAIDQGADIRIASGTRIQIPANALMHADSQQATGKAKVFYRELHNAFDVYLSGIPMSYNGGHFTTAGSFELRVRQEKENLQLKNGQEAMVRLASYESGDDYDFYRFGEQDGQWERKGTAPPEINQEKVERKKKIKRMTPSLKFPLNRRYFAFNYRAILDVYFNNNRSLFKEDEALRQKLKSYGLGWTDAEIHKRIDWKGKSEHASLMVWKNLSGKSFPEWAKHRYGRLEKLRGNRYAYTLTKKDSSDSFRVELLAVMPLKALFAYSPDYWLNNYQATMKKVEDERKYWQDMASVYRSFRLADFGIYNWDKLAKEEEAVLLSANFDFDDQERPKTVNLSVHYISGDNKCLIKFPENQWSNMKLLPDENGRLFALFPGKRLVVLPAQAYRQIPFEQLRSAPTKPEQLFELKTYEQVIDSRSALLEALAASE